MDISSLSIITPNIINTIWWNKASINNKLAKYQKAWKIFRIKRWYYINPSMEINIYQLSNMLFAESYISLDSVLFENWVIKQLSRWIYSISKVWKPENLEVWDYKLYKLIFKIETDNWIEIDSQWVRKAIPERALLDFIYFKLFSQNFPWDSELNLSKINPKIVSNLLPYYPERVQKYYLKLINE